MRHTAPFQQRNTAVRAWQRPGACFLAAAAPGPQLAGCLGGSGALCGACLAPCPFVAALCFASGRREGLGPRWWAPRRSPALRPPRPPRPPASRLRPPLGLGERRRRAPGAAGPFCGNGLQMCAFHGRPSCRGAATPSSAPGPSCLPVNAYPRTIVMATTPCPKHPAKQGKRQRHPAARPQHARTVAHSWQNALQCTLPPNTTPGEGKPQPWGALLEARRPLAAARHPPAALGRSTQRGGFLAALPPSGTRVLCCGHSVPATPLCFPIRYSFVDPAMPAGSPFEASKNPSVRIQR